MRLPSGPLTLRRLTVAVAVAASVAVGVTWGVSAARARADRELCRNHLKQIGMALDMYTSVHGSFPYGTVPSASLPVGRRLSWLVTLLDFIEGNAPNIRDKTRAWDDPIAAGLVSTDKDTERGGDVPAGSDISVYHCPSGSESHAPAGHEPTEYIGMAGLGADAPSLALGHPRAGVFGDERATPTGRISDGLGSTVAVVEAREGRGPWRAGGPSTVRGVDPSRRPYVGARRQFGGCHPAEAQALFADGSVRFLSESIDPQVFEALSTVAGGEPLPAGWDR